MQVKQCRCGGAMIEVADEHEGPVLCGEGTVYIAGSPHYVGELPPAPFEIITRETQPVFSKKELEEEQHARHRR